MRITCKPSKVHESCKRMSISRNDAEKSGVQGMTEAVGDRFWRVRLEEYS